jgi:hypothetical protein
MGIGNREGAPSELAEPPSKPKKRQRSPETPIPPDWKPTEQHRARAAELRLDLSREAELFRNHAESKGRSCVSWNAAFSTWLIKAEGFASSDTGRRPAVQPEQRSSPTIESLLRRPA